MCNLYDRINTMEILQDWLPEVSDPARLYNKAFPTIHMPSICCAIFQMTCLCSNTFDLHMYIPL